MPYLVASELTTVLPAGVSIGTNTAPLTLGEVGSIIAEISAELDGAAAGAGYTVPVSSVATQAYTQMQSWTKQGAGARVLNIIFPNVSGGPGSRTTLAAEYAAAYRDALKALRRGEMPLVGADHDAGEGARELARSYATSETTATAGVDPVFNVDTVF